MREGHGCTVAGTQQAEDTGNNMAAGTSAPFFPFLGTKEQWIPPTKAGVREVLPTASPQTAGGKPRRGGAEAAPAGPAPGSLFSRQEGGLLPTRRLRAGPLPPHKSPRDWQPLLRSLPCWQKDANPSFLYPRRSQGLTYRLPAGRTDSATPTPRLVPRQRPGPPRRPARRSPPGRARPRHALSLRAHQRLGPPWPRPPTATMTAGGRHGSRFPSTPSATGKENKGEEFLGARSAENTLTRAAPPGSACGRHFVPLEKKRPGDGGHFRALYSAAAAAPLTFTENSAAAAAAASSGSGRRGQGREGEGERKTKKGEGRGRKESGTTWNSQLRGVAAAATTRYSPPPP